jgi:FemAB-related protein (PEP-CTERM system-associated)
LTADVALVGAAARPAATLTVRAVTDTERAVWNAFVAATAGASIYHRYEWRDVVRDVFARETTYLAAFEGERIVGVLPLVRLKSPFFGDFLVSLPYFNYGGVLAASAAASEALIAEAALLGGRLGVSHIELRHRANLAASLPSRTDKVTMLLKLPATAEEFSKSVGWKVRGQVKQAQKSGAVGASGGAELIPEFYAVFAENMRDLGTPVYPQRFFERIVAAFPAETRLFVVRQGGAPVAAAFLIADGTTLEIPWASSLRRANSSNVNMLLYFNVLEYACQQGFKTFDFGRCTVDSGTYVFKKKWGAEPEQLYWHYWLRSGGELPRLNHSNPKFEAAVALWQKLPLAIANRLGPYLIRNLP